MDTGPQNWKQYAVAMMLFNTLMFVFGFLVLALDRGRSGLNPDVKGMLAPTTIFNAVGSFLTNTNLQHYCGSSIFPISARYSSFAGTCSCRRAWAFAGWWRSSAPCGAIRTWATTTWTCGGSWRTRSCRPVSSWAWCSWPTGFP